MAKILLTPQELQTQGAEMAALQKEYEAVLNRMTGTLTDVNANWSAALARNFLGKMNSAKKGCDQLVTSLGTGAQLAKASAMTFESMDQQLAKYFGGGESNLSVGQYVDKMQQTISNATDNKKKDSTSAKKKTKKKTEKKKNWWDKLCDGAEDLYDSVSTGVAKAVDVAADGVEWVVDQAVEGAEIIGNAIGDGISAIADSYNEKGTVYKLVKTGAAVVSTVGTCAGVVASWAGAAGTGGLGTGLAVTSTVYGANTIVNNFADIYNCWFGDVEDVGQVNVMKDGMNAIGEAIGGEVGGNIASAVYTAGNMVAIVNNLSNLAGKAIQLDGMGNVMSKVQGAASELKTGIGGVVDIVLHSDIANIPYDVALLTHQIPNIMSVTGMVGLAEEGVSTIVKGIDTVGDVLGDLGVDLPGIKETVDGAIDNVISGLGLDDVKSVMDVVDKTQEFGDFLTDVFGMDKWRNVGHDKLHDAWNAYTA